MSLSFPFYFNSSASSFLCLDIYKAPSYQHQYEDEAASSPALSTSLQQYEPDTNCLFGRSIPWDLVQR